MISDSPKLKLTSTDDANIVNIHSHRGDITSDFTTVDDIAANLNEQFCDNNTVA